MQKIFPYFMAALAGFIVTAVIGRSLVPLLRHMKAGQSIKTDGPTWHMSKQGTPTMGGIMFIVGITITVLIFTWQDMKGGDFSALFVLLFALVFGAIGFVDDWAKLRKKENTGLTAPQKFLLQLAAAVAFTALLRYTGHLTPNLYIPFLNTHIILPWVVYMIFAAFVMVGCVNAVNITDGIDGLAAGVTTPVALFYTVVCVLWGKAALGTFSGALLGALIGFLIYNFHPAKVFMGDTGSLFLGGAVCGLAFALDMPLILILVGIIYLVETASDIIQVAYFKLTHGKRIFRMAPLHHHLEMGGWSEKKLVFVFSGITLLFCALAYLGVAGRY
jgi:phospho-N-acetylmuramoyl-pentapeptide-transferase